MLVYIDRNTCYTCHRDNHEEDNMQKDNLKELISYLIVGACTTMVSLLTYYLLTQTLLNPKDKIELQIANILSWIISVLFAYFTNRKYVFKSKNPNMLKEGSKFVASRISTLLLDMLIMFILASLLGINDKIAKIVSQILVIIGNYIISKLFVFKKRIT